MLAVVKTKPERGIEIQDRPAPSLRADDQVLIQVGACGICGSDLHFYEWAAHTADEITLPRILGHEVAGTVVKVGPAVKDFKPGDRVVTETWGGCGDCYYCRLGMFNHCLYQTRIGQKADGGMTDYVVVPAISLYRIPDDMPFDEAAVIEPVGVALRGWEKIRNFKPGDAVVVMGPGPIGILGALIARAAGAATVLITGLKIDQARLSLARQLGLETITVGEENVQEKVKNLTQGRGAEVVLDLSGGSGSLSQAISLAKIGGEIGLIGISPPSETPLQLIALKELTIYGSFRRLPSTWYRAIKLVAARQIDVRPLITHRFPVAKAEEAFQALFARQAMKAIIYPEKKQSREG
jgi:2-desacetyl-2-hydroxyethyl bacteriochlorophyllide A dehydrogenase